jgi:hypothetical protein
MTQSAKDELRRQKTRNNAREAHRVKIMMWYLDRSGGIPPEVQCEDKRLNGEVRWHLEPPIPGEVNPRLVERYLGDQWVLFVEPLPGTGIIP